MTLDKQSLSALLMISILTGCASTHFNITREIGLLPPKIEDHTDFSETARDRCRSSRETGESECTQYWETVLWAQDYRSYVRARAIINRDIIYLGGVVALAGVGALAGFSALDHTSSDAYKILPIAGTFLGGLLAFSRNEALYEAYELAGMKIDETLLQAKKQLGPQGNRGYGGGATLIREGVGAAIKELTKTKIAITKFQSQSEAEQFKVFQAASTERDLASFSLSEVTTDKAGNIDPTIIKATLNIAPDPQKLSASELLLKLTNTKSGGANTLRLSSLEDATLNAEIPAALLDDDNKEKTFLVEVQARNGNYTLRVAKPLTLKFSEKVRLDVEVKGEGKVTYKNWKGTDVICSKENTCPPQKVKKDMDTALEATGISNGKQANWTVSLGTCQAGTPCKITPSVDTTVTMEVRSSP